MDITWTGKLHQQQQHTAAQHHGGGLAGAAGAAGGSAAAAAAAAAASRGLPGAGFGVAEMLQALGGPGQLLALLSNPLYLGRLL